MKHRDLLGPYHHHSIERKEMDIIPAEIIEKHILPHLGGIDFLSFRRTCKRHRDVVDQAELWSKPSIWHRFLFKDFHLACVQSVSSLFNNMDIENSVLSKKKYVLLNRATFLSSQHLKTVHFSISSNEVWDATDLKFYDDMLLLLNDYGEANLLQIEDCGVGSPYLSMSLSSLKHTLHQSLKFKTRGLCGRIASHSPAPLKVVSFANTDGQVLLINGTPHHNLRIFSNHVVSGNVANVFDFSPHLLSCWCHFCLAYSPTGQIDGVEKAVLSLWTCQSSGCTKIVSLPLPQGERLITIDFNSFVVIAVAQCSRELYILPIDAYQMSWSCPPKSWLSVPLQEQPVKVKLLGNLVFLLFDSGRLCTATLDHEKCGEVVSCTLDPVLGLDGQRPRSAVNLPGLMQYVIVDFALCGVLFAAVSSSGEVFMSNLKELCPTFVQKHLRKVDSIKMEPHGRITRLALTLQKSGGGAILVLLERFQRKHTYWQSVQHVLFIEKGKILTF